MNRLKLQLTSVLITALVLFAISIIDYTAPAQSQDDSEKITTEVAVHTGTVIRTTLHGYVKAYGTVAPQKAGKDVPSAHSRISTPIAGVIENVSCVEGQLIKKGTLLFHLDSRLTDVQILKASETYQFAQRNLERQKKRVQAEMASLEILREKSEEALEFAQQNFDRQKKLFAENGTSQKNYQEAKHLLASTQNELLDIRNQQNLLDLSPEQAAAEQQLIDAKNELIHAQTQRDLMDVKAPMSGTITSIHVNPGEAVDASTILAELIDMDHLEIFADVPSKEASLIKRSQAVNILDTNNASMKTNNQKESLFQVLYINQKIDPMTDTSIIRVSVPANSGLRPGQYIPFQVIYEKHENCLAVPYESVVSDEEGHRVVFIVNDGKAVQAPVQEGLREGALVEIKGPDLREGLTIVTEGAYGLPNESAIRVVN